MGAHSDKHLLYCDWTERDSLLVTKEEFISDVLNNYKEIANYTSEFPKYYMPPYEWYNKQIAQWTKELGITLINYSPGTSSNGDYTIPVKGERYYSSDSIYNKILSFEKNNKNHLNGFILLSHIGTDPRRTDKFYNKLDQLITEMKKRGYKFVRIDELLN